MMKVKKIHFQCKKNVILFLTKYLFYIVLISVGLIDEINS